MPNFIFVTGGVVSSLGKGIVSSSLGSMLQSYGFKVLIRKFDPYLNIDPGTMSPYEHGEVFVTEDGAETDLDLGNYERFTGINTTKYDSITMGQIYSKLLQKERVGDYLGATLQVVPHVTDLIKETFIKNTENADFVICEIGGTVGDIESQAFLEAVRQFIHQKDTKIRSILCHVTLIPYVKAADELKTKPTQHSVHDLQSLGLQPNLLLCRSEKEVPDYLLSKIGLFCNIPKERVFPVIDVNFIYKIPVIFCELGLDKQIFDLFNISNNMLFPKFGHWYDIINKSDNYKHSVKIAIVGKYVSYTDAYKSLIEALCHAGLLLETKVEIQWISSSDSTDEFLNKTSKLLASCDAILVPGGFGSKGIEGKIEVIKYARENNIPFLGICLGMQLAVVEAAKSLAKIQNASSTEFNPTGTCVIELLEKCYTESNILSTQNSGDLGGTMRLGVYPCYIMKDSKAAEIYSSATIIHERHRHRYAVNINYKEVLEKAGLIFSGTSSDGKLMEIIEIKNHPFFIAVQFHPEFKSKPFEPHPLFNALLKAGLEFKDITNRSN